MRSGDPSTVSEATEPANMPASKPTSSAMRAERGSNTEPGCTQRSPAKRARKRSRRWVQRMVEASPRLTCFIGGGIRTYTTRLDSLFSIGQAAFRERVCQYVWISGDDVVEKK